MNVRTLRLLEYDKIRQMLREYAASSLGKEHIERMRPVRDMAIVRARIQETSEACSHQAANGSAPIGGLRDIRDLAVRARKQGVLSAQELLDVAQTATCTRRMKQYLAPCKQDRPLLHEQGKLLSEFLRLERAIAGAISLSGEVLDGASPELDRARRRMRSLHDEMQRELQRIIAAPHMVDQLQEAIITQRNGRFCVPVKAECRNSFKGIVHDLSASGQTVFMEPLSVVELGNDLREAERREEEEIQRVLAGLSGMVGSVADALIASMETAGRLDVIFARALFSRSLEAVEPDLNTDGIIDLQQARHPLLGPSAVPIDIRLGEDGLTTLLITGPNTGGKTVTLKTVGLLTLMAQSGMHIPALPGSRIAIFEQVFADIGDEQSIEQSLSTFSSHMTNIVRIIREANGKSLVLFDEIGAGTDPAEGAALGKAILLDLQARGCRTIATTHYGELKVFGQSTEGFENASVEFDLETLRPTYRLMQGLPGSSNALSISQRLGLPKTLVARARELIGEEPQAMEQLLKQAEGARRALDRERVAMTRYRREAEDQTQQLKRQQQEFDDKRDALLAKARKQAEDVLQKARIEVNGLLDELKSAVKEARAQAQSTLDTGELRRRTRVTLNNVSEEIESLPKQEAPPVVKTVKPILTAVKAGQTVYVRSVGHRGQALESGHGDDEVDVQVGIMRLRVPVSDLEASAANTAAAVPMTPPKAKHEVQVMPEIQLLGKRAEEASNELETYLYDALEWGLERVRIVHGFGTGALKQVVQNQLRHHPAVKSYRAGQPSEGGGGVTIAELGR